MSEEDELNLLLELSDDYERDESNTGTTINHDNLFDTDDDSVSIAADGENHHHIMDWTDSDDENDSDYTADEEEEDEDTDDDNSIVNNLNPDFNYCYTGLDGPNNEITVYTLFIEYEGIAVIGRLDYKKGLYYSDCNDYENMLKYYNESIEIGYVDSMINMGIYYETRCHDYVKAEEMYLMAVDHYDSDAMYNLADMYDKIGERGDDKMIKYFNMAIEYGDKESIVRLFKYYHHLFQQTTDPEIEIRVQSNMVKYYALAVETIPQLHNGVQNTYCKRIIKLDIFQRNDLWKKIIENTGIPQNEIAAENYRLLRSEKDLIVYENKIRLFTSLNHVADCPICFDHRLQIDIHCGHTFCTDCYAKVYKKVCPLCRISP
jgi:tetratricopeptide (TPR) repeat protein